MQSSFNLPRIVTACKGGTLAPPARLTGGSVDASLCGFGCVGGAVRVIDASTLLLMVSVSVLSYRMGDGTIFLMRLRWEQPGP